MTDAQPGVGGGPAAVMDASAVVELLLGGERGRAVTEALVGETPEADPARGATFAAAVEPRLHAPDLLDLEVAQAFRRLVAADAVSDRRATESIRLLARLPVTRHPARALLPRVWALRGNLSSYDAAYVALAEALRCPVLTCDRRLASAPGHRAVVRVVGSGPRADAPPGG